jgi:hypothetical protein
MYLPLEVLKFNIHTNIYGSPHVYASKSTFHAKFTVIINFLKLVEVCIGCVFTSICKVKGSFFVFVLNSDAFLGRGEVMVKGCTLIIIRRWTPWLPALYKCKQRST